MSSTFQRLNEVAKGQSSLYSAVSWFESLDPGEQARILRNLVLITGQSHPLPAELSLAIEVSGLKIGATPCVLLKTHPLPTAMAKMLGLPNPENSRSFRLLLSLFSIADTRRRETVCGKDCHHPWHDI